MALMQRVENGKILDNSPTASTDKKDEAAKKKNGLDKEAFLQLLVAQMQYQDPLEPMDNTEYVAQLATFSQLEATQNMTDRITSSTANDLVGKYVILNSDAGNESGKVDYVMYKDGEVFLAVNDGIFSLDDLDSVADNTYYEAFQMAEMFSALVKSIPAANKLTAADADQIKNIRSVYESMNSYQQGFVSREDLEKLTEAEKKIHELTGNTSTGGNDANKDTEVTNG